MSAPNPLSADTSPAQEPTTRVPPFAGGGGSKLWSADLTDAQLLMITESGENRHLGGGGYGVELRGTGAWKTARSLVAKGLGTIEDGIPNGSSLPGLYFNNEEGVRILHEFDELADEDDGSWGPL